MKYISCFALLLCCILAVQAQEKFLIEGKLDSLKEPSMIYLTYDTDKGSVRDSMLAENGTFTFKGTLGKPLRASVYTSLQSAYPRQFWIEKGRTTIAGDNLKTATVTGGEIQADQALLDARLQPLAEVMEKVSDLGMKYLREKNQPGIEVMKAHLRFFIEERFRIQKEFIGEHPNSYVSLSCLKEIAPRLDLKAFASLFNGLNQRLRSIGEGKELAALLAKGLKTDVGQPAPDFTQDNTDGHPVPLASLKGKYVLVDFWASWCDPCRKENPNLVRAYQRFKGRNFEIIGVSLDDKKEAWLKAIKDDGLTWIHVSDLKRGNNAAANEYAISLIPSNFLLGPDGIIIARNLHGEALEKKLEEVLGGK
ncbi:redoxin domain-containing protein [Chitinophaga sp. 22321]|uniref:AhpC/TSA family protein n=1 Tax=Chitinophaga hostae TaxID=2831022 RepID=A0ABS5IYX5_9BACT|nr:TlpA disulfide reductase family protein [Chitinophaga hostae]MBS0028174.1 AhpC/TSA family protein [Chitinophaga hostae]